MTLDLLFGRLHPLFVHFPIALIILASVVEVARIKWDHPTLGTFVVFLLAAGAVGSLAASATGWIFANDYYPAPSEQWMLGRHRWLGVSTTVLAGTAVAVANRWASATTRKTLWLRRGVIWITALAVTITAHLGALMVWGTDYFMIRNP